MDIDTIRVFSVPEYGAPASSIGSRIQVQPRSTVMRL